MLGEIVKEGWLAQRDFLLLASNVKEPGQQKLVASIGPIQAAVQKANKAIQRNDFEMHAKTVAEVGQNSCYACISDLVCFTYLI